MYSDNNENVAFQRYKYSSKYDLRFIFVGLVINYGTLLRIPSGVYNHGSSFVAAYLILSVLMGFPLIFLELQFGQFYTRGPYNVFRICPLFEGLGMCFVTFCAWCSMYYVFLMAHGIHLMAETFYTSINLSSIIINRMLPINQSFYSEINFYAKKVDFYSSENSPKLVWNLSFALCLLTAWLIIYIVTSKQLIKKQYYVKWSFLSPFIMIIFLAALYIAKPNFSHIFVHIKFNDWEEFSSPELWVTALQQVLLSTGIGTGIIVTFSSYNDFNSNRLRDDTCSLNVIAIVVNVLVGIMFAQMAGTLKYYDQNENLLVPRTPVEVQLLYFNMIDYLPLPQLWMFIMNFLFIFTGTVSVQLFLEVLFVTLKDNISFARWKARFLHSISCSVLCLISLAICIDTRYIHAANAVDAALNGAVVYLEAILLLVIISIYGINNIFLDIRFIFKEHPKGILIYLKYFWIISFVIIFVLTIIKWAFLFSNHYLVEIVILVLIFLPLLGLFVYNCFKYALKKRCSLLFQPVLVTGPENAEFRLLRRSFVMSESIM